MPLKSIFPDIDLPEGITLHEYMLNGPASENPMATALIDSETGDVRTFNHVRKESMAIAAALHVLGVRKGDIVAVSTPNCMEYVSILAGITSRGAIHCAISPVYTQDEMEYYLNHSTAKFIFVSKESIFKVTGAARKLGLNMEFILIGDTQQTEYPANVTRYEDFLKMAENIHPPPVEINPKLDPAVIFYTSGTTARPKGILRSHASIINSRELVFNNSLYDMPKKSDHMIANAPMVHVMGLMNAVKSISAGYPLIIVRKYEAEKMLMLIEKYKVPVLFWVPSFAIYLTKNELVSKYDISSLRSLILYAAPSGKELTKDVMNRLPHIKTVTQGYGLTETAPIFFSPKSNTKPGSAGMIVPNNVCKIVNVVTGKECGPFEPGEIRVKTQTMFSGYFRNEKETAKMFDEDGWFCTGDVAYYDDDQYFFIVDRMNDILKVDGIMVSPAAIEDVLLSHPDIVDAAVVGIFDPIIHEKPKAFVVKRPGSNSTEADIVKFVEERLTSYKCLRAGVEFIDSIPRSPIGKILRRVLKQRDQEKQEA